MEMLTGTAFALRPDYEKLVKELGEPPLGVPDELTFAYAWDLACKKIDHENRVAEKAARTASKEAPAKKAPAKAPAKKPAKRAPAKRKPTVASRLNAEFGK